MSNVKTPMRTVLTLASLVAGNFARNGKRTCSKKLAENFPLIGVINKNKVNREYADSVMTPIHDQFVHNVIAHGLSSASHILSAAPSFEKVAVEDTGSPLLKLTDVSFTVGAFRLVFTICNDKLAATRYALYKGVSKTPAISGNVMKTYGELTLNDYDASAPEMELENIRSGREMTVLFSMASSSLILQALNIGKEAARAQGAFDDANAKAAAPDDEPFEEPDDEEFEELDDEDEDEDDDFEDSRASTERH